MRKNAKTGLALGAFVASAVSAWLAFSGCRTSRPSFDWNRITFTIDRRYGPRDDAPGEGTGAYTNRISHLRAHDGHLVHSHRSGQFYDVIRLKDPLPAHTPVYVNLHGGAWSDIADKDGEDFLFLARIAEMGFVVVNMDYQLQEPLYQPGTGARAKERPQASFDDMLRDIDTCVSHVKHTLAPSLGIRPGGIAIGGGSAGAHLACLYAYDHSRPEVLGLGLRHELPVAFVVDVVGPTDLADPDLAKPFFEKDYTFGSFLNDETCDRMVSLFGYLVKTDLRALIAKGDLEGARGRLAHYSPINLIGPRAAPTILAYCRVFPWSRDDGCVPVSTFYAHCRRLEENGVAHEGDIRSWRLHGWLREDFTGWLLDRIRAYKDRFLPGDAMPRKTVAGGEGKGRAE